MSKTIGIKVSKKFRDIIKEAARDENRTISNFIKHAVLTYLAEKKGIDFKEDDPD